MTARMEHFAEVQILNRYGLHARPAAELVKLTNRFAADVWVEKGGMEVNAKSIMGVLMLGAECGSTLRVRATGADAEAAVGAVKALVFSRFGED